MEVPAELKLRYLERRKEDLVICQQSLDAKQFTEIEKIGHQLKGNGATFGHPDLSVLGKNIELAAKAHDFTELEHRLKEFSHWIDEKSN